MPRVAKELSALEVKRLQHSGTEGNQTVAVGGVSGLLLQLAPSGGRTWLLRVSIGGRRREIGLGGFPDVTLAQARDYAREMKNKIRHGIDPVEERKSAKAALAAARVRGLTFAEATDRCLNAKLDAFANAKHRDQWRNTLQTYAMPQLGRLLVSEITVQDVLRVLEPIWQSKTETASRLRGRIETVLSWATVAGHRTGDNPARWGGNLKELLPAPSKVATKRNHPAVRFDDAPRWFSELRKLDGFGSRALEFAALTAARSEEVRGAEWEELDLKSGLWIIPATRMKMKREHRVPLSAAAVDLLQSLPRLADSPLVFPGKSGGQLSDMTLSATMRRIHEADLASGGPGFLDRVNKRPAVPHGLRSTFSDWVSETTRYPSEMTEVALSHKIASAVEAAYRRGDMLDKRRQMMTDWANYLAGTEASDVTVVNWGSR
jgi:integrase